MKYISTRGKAPSLSFNEAVLAGLAIDGGLYVPESLPYFTPQALVAMQGMEYAELFDAVIKETGCSLRGADIYGEAFAHPAVAPLKQLGSNDWLLELFHGPTLAFKDFALQFLGRLIEDLLQDAQGTSNPSKCEARSGGGSEAMGGKTPVITILGATSGDTGSAAIAGCRGRKNMRIVILHPHERTSLVQRKQMTTVLDENVHNIAIEGSFDDCQNIVKALFVDAEFRAAQQLTAVNSINWARILAQVVYYFYAALRLGAPMREVCFSVPTGNFGDIYAGYLAKKMGLPIKQLIIASNRNDILTRCVQMGEYRNAGVEPSLSPSMDIQISSNFERLLFGYYVEAMGPVAAADAIAALMETLKTTGSFKLPEPIWHKLKADFSAHSVSDAETTETISRIYKETGEILDPHTAVGVRAAQACRKQGDETPMVTLATAHPAKFPDAVKQAIAINPPLPAHLADLFSLKERFDILPAEAKAVKRFIRAL